MALSRSLLAAIIVVAVFVMSTWWGNLAAYCALFAALAAIPFVLERRALAALYSNWGIRAFSLAFLLLGVALALSANSPADIGALGDFVVLLLAWPVFALLFLLKDRISIQHLALAALAGSAVSCAVSVYEVFVLGQGRATGNVSSAIFMGNVSTILGYLALTGVWGRKDFLRWIYLAGPILGGFAAILSGTRGALLATFLIVVVLGVYTGFRRPAARMPLVVGVVLGAFCLSAGVLLLGDSSNLVDRIINAAYALMSGESAEASISYRLQFYDAGLAAIWDSPLYGHGWWRRFSAAVPYMSGDVIAGAYEVGYAHLHNEPINFAVGMGFLGLLAYVLITLAPLLAVRWADESDRAMAHSSWAIVLTVGVVGMGMTDAMFIFEMPKTVFVFSAAMLFALAADKVKR